MFLFFKIWENQKKSELDLKWGTPDPCIDTCWARYKKNGAKRAMLRPWLRKLSNNFVLNIKIKLSSL